MGSPINACKYNVQVSPTRQLCKTWEKTHRSYMGKENQGFPSASHSSIFLLQERFRQLQRAKEMREERELIIRMLAVAPEPNKHYFNNIHVKPTMYCEPPARLLPHPQRPLQAAPPPKQVSVSHWQSSVDQRSHIESGSGACTTGTPPLMNLWPKDDDTPSSSDTSNSSNKLSEDYLCVSDSDVDTSLHLWYQNPYIL